jgi:hypothetical protein
MNRLLCSNTIHIQRISLTLLALLASVAACAGPASRDVSSADARAPLPALDLTPTSVDGTSIMIPSAIEFTLTSAAPGQLITSFESSLSQADPGDQITLRWLTVGSKITIYTMSNEGNFVTAWENLPAQGERVVTIEPAFREHVDYVLIVEAGSLVETQTARVSLRCLDKWFFTDPPDSCPQSAIQFTSAVYQPFERGWMVWLAAAGSFPQNTISVFLNDQNHYRVSISNPWKPGLPESDPALTPPPGLLQPMGGFGLVWRDAVIGLSFNLRERIGWATAAEATYQAGYQCEGGKRYGSCFLSLADGRILELPYAGEGWRLWSK